MNRLLPAAVAFALLLPAFARAQDDQDVTISRSRLLELERKEAELNKMKGQLQKTETEKETLKKQRDAAEQEKKKAQAALTNAPSIPTRPVPPIAALPPLTPGDVVDAADLAAYFGTDAASAEKRFDRVQIQVRGSITGFDRSMFSRNYDILLATGQPGAPKVICEFVAADRYSAVFPVNNGSELVGLQGETRVPLARTGETVVISGLCKGLKKGAVHLTGCKIEPNPTTPAR